MNKSSNKHDRRYSGVTEETLQDVKTTLSDVQVKEK